MLKKCLALLILTTIIFSCKKKESTSTQSNSTSATTTGGTTGSISLTTLGTSTGGEFCSMQTTYSFWDYNGTVTKDSAAFATFYATPPSSVAPTNIFGGNVTLNAVAVPFSSVSTSYYTSGLQPINIAGPLTWSVSGSGTVTPFTVSYAPSYPKYTGGNLLPDTIVQANGATINISGVTNSQNFITVYCYGGSTSAFKYIIGSSGSVTFSPSDLSGFPVNQPFTLIVGVANFYSATLGGVKRGFANTISYQKACYMK